MSEKVEFVGIVENYYDGFVMWGKMEPPLIGLDHYRFDDFIACSGDIDDIVKRLEGRKVKITIEEIKEGEA